MTPEHFNFNSILWAIRSLRAARNQAILAHELLEKAGAPRAAAKALASLKELRRALESAEGAKRHAADWSAPLPDLQNNGGEHD